MEKNFKSRKMCWSKRGGIIGTTLTWIPAFILIFFILLLFMLATAFLSAKKGSNLLGTEEEWANKEKNVYWASESLDMEADLKNILDIKSSYSGKKVEQLIKMWALEKNEIVQENLGKEIDSEIHSYLEKNNFNGTRIRINFEGKSLISDYFMGIDTKMQLERFFFIGDKKVQIIFQHSSNYKKEVQNE